MNKPIKIKSVQANSLYMVNNNYKNSYLDSGEAVINNSLFSEYMRKHGVVVDKKSFSKDLIVLKFDYGIKNGLSSQKLRDYYYNNGADYTWKTYNKEGNVICEKLIHYKMLCRSSGKAKDGSCIFIRDNLHKIALDYITMKLYDNMGTQNAKIVELSAYSTLTTATALEFIRIPLKNILILKDEKADTLIKANSVKTKNVSYIKQSIDYSEIEELINEYHFTFYKKKQKDNPNLKYIKKSKKALEEVGIKIRDLPMKNKSYTKKECYVERSEKKVKVSNILWDGMGLIDDCLFPDSENISGFIYCRSHFFKSCLFRGSIQQYFRDFYKNKYDTAIVTDMFGNEIKVSDIKVIITENSIKWIKFIDLMGGTEKKAYNYYKRFMNKHNNMFEIVKTSHLSKWGDLQRSSFQINNSLPCTDKEILKKIADCSINYCNKLKMDHRVFMKHLSIGASKRYSINNVLIALDNLNENFKYTKYFKAKKNSIISSFKNERLKQGKLLQYGDNLTICGNPIALLMKVTGQDFMQDPCFEKIDNGIQCYTTRFKDGERLAGFRSPHNAPNNIVHLVNTYSEPIQKYFSKLGNGVIIINGIETDVQSRLNGQDLDTDSIFTTNQPDIVRCAEYAYLNYLTIINDIELSKNSVYGKDMSSYAKMDNKISSSQYAIGNASNKAQLALSYYYDSGSNNKELEDVFIICSVLAQIAIDSAKRSFEINVNSELNRLSSLECMKPIDNKIYPEFYANIQMTQKENENIDDDKIRKFNCPMEILAALIEENVIDLRKYKELISHTCNLNVVFQYQADRTRDSKQYKKIISIVKEYNYKINTLDRTEDKYSEKVNRHFNNCLDKLKNLNINKSTMSSLIAFAFSENGDIRDRLLTVLYDKDPNTFLKCFKKSPKSSAKVS